MRAFSRFSEKPPAPVESAGAGGFLVWRSALGAAGGKTGHEMLLGEEEYDSGRDRHQDGGRGEIFPLRIELGHELLETVRQGVFVVGLDERRRVRDLAPGGEEGVETGD